MLFDINEKHEDLKKRLIDYEDIDYILEGERIVKQQGTRFVSKLGGQDDEEYKAYVNRSLFYEAYTRTVQGFSGLILRKQPVMKYPEQLEPFINIATQKGLSFSEVRSKIIHNNIAYGRYGVLVDIDNNGKPYLSEYAASNILNWASSVVKGTIKLSYLSLREEGVLRETKPGLFVKMERIRILSFDESGYLEVRVYEEIENGGYEIVKINDNDVSYPNINGKRLDYIPFVFFGPLSNSYDIEKPPLLGLMFINLAHYRITTDFYHGLHFCCLPTLYLLGFNDDEGIQVGPGRQIRNRNPDSKVGMVEATGKGFDHVKEELEKLEAKMAALGGRFLEAQKKAAETAETVRLRSSGEQTSLTSITLSCEKGIKKILQYAARWLKLDEEKIIVELNKDFVDSQISPSLIDSLLRSLQAGQISQETFLYNLKQGEILEDNITVEDEMKRIEIQRKELESKMQSEALINQKQPTINQQQPKTITIPEVDPGSRNDHQ